VEGDYKQELPDRKGSDKRSDLNTINGKRCKDKKIIEGDAGHL
jgi:hypothetical protein